MLILFHCLVNIMDTPRTFIIAGLTKINYAVKLLIIAGTVATTSKASSIGTPFNVQTPSMVAMTTTSTLLSSCHGNTPTTRHIETEHTHTTRVYWLFYLFFMDTIPTHAYNYSDHKQYSVHNIRNTDIYWLSMTCVGWVVDHLLSAVLAQTRANARPECSVVAAI